MISQLIFVFLTHLIIFVYSVPPIQQEVPKSWQDDWIIGFEDTELKISPTSLSTENKDLFVIEIQTFLDEWSVISADGTKRCNICHVFKEWHPNILTMQTSDCLSQVNAVFSRVQATLTYLCFSPKIFPEISKKGHKTSIFRENCPKI